MYTVTANEAKTQFGATVLKAQREPVQINKNGKPVAVLLSVEEYQCIEQLKLELIKERMLRAKDALKQGDLLDGQAVFNRLINNEV